MKTKKIPLRRCAGCGEQKPKGDLVRVVRTPEGRIVLDETGKQNGRGVYLCPASTCFSKARKMKRLERSLDCAIPDEVWDRLEKELVP